MPWVTTFEGSQLQCAGFFTILFHIKNTPLLFRRPFLFASSTIYGGCLFAIGYSVGVAPTPIAAARGKFVGRAILLGWHVFGAFLGWNSFASLFF